MCDPRARERGSSADHFDPQRADHPHARGREFGGVGIEDISSRITPMVYPRIASTDVDEFICNI
jgi:hypothetical protein